MRTGRTPVPVGTISSGTETVAESIFLKIRKCQKPMHIFVRHGDVFALNERYAVCMYWDVMYPEDFIGSFTRAARPYQIKRHLDRALDFREVENEG